MPRTTVAEKAFSSKASGRKHGARKHGARKRKAHKGKHRKHGGHLTHGGAGRHVEQFKPEKSKHSRYGWIPDLPDPRDLAYVPPPAVLAALPPHVDLSQMLPPPFDQGEINSCTANAIASAIQFQQIRQSRAGQAVRVFTPSRLFIYYNERASVNMIYVDRGVPIRAGIKSVARQGVCMEDWTHHKKHGVWPYDPDRFESKPSKHCYTFAVKNRTLHYRRLVQELNHMKTCLAEGHPFVFGMLVFAELERPNFNGIAHEPAPNESPVTGHAVLAVGYDDDSKTFLVRNSWGVNWGLPPPHRGHFELPYGFVTNPHLVSDLWTIRFVEPK